MDKIQIDLDRENFTKKFKDWVENNSLKNFTIYCNKETD